MTAPDFVSRAAWADVYRDSHRPTSAWHFADIEIDHPDLNAACFGFPRLAHGQPASQGTSQDCVVNKLEEFEAELKDSAASAAERFPGVQLPGPLCRRSAPAAPRLGS